MNMVKRKREMEKVFNQLWGWKDKKWLFDKWHYEVSTSKLNYPMYRRIFKKLGYKFESNFNYEYGFYAVNDGFVCFDLHLDEYGRKVASAKEIIM